MDVNIPEVVAEVSAASDRYEQALVATPQFDVRCFLWKSGSRLGNTATA